MDGVESAPGEENLVQLLRDKIENIRPKLLDLSRRNPLISSRLGRRSGSFVQIVDELPDVLAFNFASEKSMRLVPLPSLDDDPMDEQTREFRNAFSEARLIDETYLEQQEQFDQNAPDALDRSEQIERELKDRLRERLGMPARASKGDQSLIQHAKNNHISPSYDLPLSTEEHEDGRHTDDDIQTLLLPDELERKLNGISTKSRTWIQESGINVLRAAFGFLEWKEPNSQNDCFAPLVLLPVELIKKRKKDGLEFWVKGGEDPAETNLVLVEKLKIDFGIELPIYQQGSIEDYLELVSDVSPNNLNMRVRRQVVIGVFPSSRMAMYHDLDTSIASFENSEILKTMLVGSEETSDEPFGDEYEIDSPEIEEKVPHVVMDADSSQFSALVDLADGRNLAVEGPPGTGKSQTIVNAIASALAAGKKILFVAEKMAALDVVKARLEFVGLGEFVLPLQAERSTKEKVIQSIRDRVEMEVRGGVRDLENTLENFRKYRAELAEYLAIISQKFGNSDLTVHEILGKNIATQRFLSDLPPDIQKIDFERVEEMSASDLHSVKDAAVSLGRAWQAVRKSERCWDGLKVPNIDKFLVEDICEAANDVAAGFRSVDILAQKLGGFGLTEDQYDLDLELLKLCLDEVEIPQIPADAQLVDRLVDEDEIIQIEEFLSECDAVRNQVQILEEMVDQPTDVAWKDRLAEIEHICLANEFKTLNLKKLRDQQREDDGVVEELQKHLLELQPFLEAFPECREFVVSDLQSASKLISETDNAVLGLRNETTASPEATAVIGKACELGENLQYAAEIIGERMSLAAGNEPQYLRKLASQIAGAGAFRFMSSAYRSAKREFMELSYSNEFDKDAAVSDLRAYADWLDEKTSFLKLPALDRVLGPHNLGLDTDFSAFKGLLEFYSKVDQGFPGIDKMSIRKILKQADQNLISSIPQLPGLVWDGDYKNLQQHIEILCERREKFDAEVEKLSKLLSGVRVAEQLSLDGLKTLQENIKALHQSRAVLSDNNPVRDVLQSRFHGPDTSSVDVASELAIAKALLPAADQWKNFTVELLGRNSIEEFRSVLGEFLDKSRESTDLLSSLLKLTGQPETHYRNKRNCAELADFLQRAVEESTELYVQSSYAAALRAFEKIGPPDVVDICHENEFDLSDLPPLIEALVARGLAKRVYRDFGASLGRFQGAVLDDLREKLANADKKIIELTRGALRREIKLSANPPPGRRIGKKSEWTEWALIENEINKKKRFVPVRDLTARSGRALQELKPCWMMSPLAVAQYIPRNSIEFDLCIIDEASQMPPEDAFGALVRSKQTMIVGDTNQLPPTSFFRRMIDEEDADEDENVLDESILELANAAFRPKRRLRWHYRSRHSGLIKFSNRLVYDDDLIVFPSAYEDHKDMGVSLVKVDGVYKSGVNGPEAHAMVNAALDFMEQNPDRSLGIVTLNQKQRDLLIEEMEYALRDRRRAAKYIDFWNEKKDGLESFFVKNLENVQGDERDVIFIGTVYGPAERGSPVMQRFGPINGLAGKRRLNVLFSRAKEQIVTFSSMTAADIRADESGNPGTYMLKRWLEYSATGVLDAGTVTHKEPDSEFEVYVIDQINAMGCEAVPQVGVAGYFIDIGVKHPDWPHGFILGVECDGASYHSSKSARDRDRLRQEVLEGLGWHFHRIWSTDWFNDPMREAVRLRDVITERLDDLKREAGNFSSDGREKSFTDDVGVAYQEFDGNLLEIGEMEQPSESKNSGAEFSDGVKVGDTVHVYYLNEPENKLKVTLSAHDNDPVNGIVGTSEPLGEALLGAEEGEEIDVLIGSHIRRAVVEKIERETPVDDPGSYATTRTEETLKQRSETANRSFKVPGTIKNRTNDQPEESVSEVSETQTSIRAHRLRPDDFHDPDYRFTLRDVGIRIIDQIGPISHLHLCQMIARLHGFKRTGAQIRKTVSAAVHKERKFQKDKSGEVVYWPRHLEPRTVIEFRGLNLDGEERDWKYVPYPEKLGLALEAVSARGRSSPLDHMVKRIGLRRLTATTRTELEELIGQAREVDE